MPNQHNKLLLTSFSLPLPCCSHPFSANRHWNRSKQSTLANQPLKRVASVTLAGHKRGVRVGDSSWRHMGNHLFQQLHGLKALGKPSAKSRRSEYKGVEIQSAVPQWHSCPTTRAGVRQQQAQQGTPAALPLEAATEQITEQMFGGSEDFPPPAPGSTSEDVLQNRL